MKKFLLTCVISGLTLSTAVADEYTFLFEGDENIGGWERQFTKQANDLQFVDEFSLSESGIEFGLTQTAGTGKGFALVNAGGSDQGIYIAAQTATEIVLTVPGGHITGARMALSGYALGALDISFNGANKSGVANGAIYNWSWSDSEGGETLTIAWDVTFMPRYIHSLSITYTADLGGKEACGLEFSEPSVEAVIGEDFVAPTLLNPNNLKVSWTSSRPEVAAVDAEGKVTLLSGGTTVITASTEGDADFAAGSVRYELTVIPSATSLEEMAELAGEPGDKVKVNFPLTVTYGRGSFAFVIDEAGNVSYIEDTRNENSTGAAQTLFKVGDVVAAGWIATNATANANVLWRGLPASPTETVEVTYPEVTGVTKADADRVVILKSVTFATATASDNTKAFGTTPDGTRYEFQDTFSVGSYPAGTYNVTCVVEYFKFGSTEYFYLSPISYQIDEESGVEEIGAVEKQTAEYFDLQGRRIAEPTKGLYIRKNGNKAGVSVK